MVGAFAALALTLSTACSDDAGSDATPADTTSTTTASTTTAPSVVDGDWPVEDPADHGISDDALEEVRSS